jgi:folate-binding protein YgfZ
MGALTSTTIARLHLLRDGALVVSWPAAIFQVAGPGALACLQGLLTNDLEKPGDGTLVYGALLTPKGAIIVDLWVLRMGDRFLLLAEREARGVTLDLLRKSLPPRLARVTDLSDSHTALRLLGTDAGGRSAAAGLTPVPAIGRTSETAGLITARADVNAPFHALLVGENDAIAAARERLLKVGAEPGTPDDIESARILAGWPRLGREIQDKTLVQEVRYDELGGVSYTKGCYTGQETVARLHFRGHTNRELRGLRWISAPLADGDSVFDVDGKEVGRITSRLMLPDQWLGLASIRREVAPGTVLTAAGAPATVVSLPFPVAE